LNEILSNYVCDIIICEYNATHSPSQDKIVKYEKYGRWDGTNYFGMSILSIKKLGEKYNYSIVYCNSTGVNCFLIHNNIIKSKSLNFANMSDISKLYRLPTYGNGPQNGHRQDPNNRTYVSSNEVFTQILTEEQCALPPALDTIVS
jgi:hypothetical protein